MRRVNLEKILFILHFHRLEFMTRQGYNVKKVSTKIHGTGTYLSLLDVQYLTLKGITSTNFQQKIFFGTRPAGSNYPSKGLGGVYHLISCRYC